jgi:predicted Rossmann fold flavoprotein
MAKAKVQGTRLEEQGPVLITHWGLSGPAILKLSARGAREMAAMNYRFTVMINWCPSLNDQSVREKMHESRIVQASQKVVNRNNFAIPQRLWEHLCGISDISGLVRWADLPAAGLNRLAKNISGQELKVEGKTTFKEEFVTAGGVTLSEIDPQTMESRLVKGLFFAGEIMDVDGVTGGFNFQHAWTSGWIAGKNVANFRIFAPPN